MKTTSPAPVQELANQVGSFIQYWGFKSVHGRLWTHLFLSETPLDAGTLIKRLGVSKALVSMSLKDLGKYRVIRPAGKSQEGTLLYEVNPDITGVILNVLRMRERRIIDKVLLATESLREVSPEDRAHWGLSADRMEAMGELVRTGRKTLESFLVLSNTDLRDWKRFQSLDA